MVIPYGLVVDGRAVSARSKDLRLGPANPDTPPPDSSRNFSGICPSGRTPRVVRYDHPIPLHAMNASSPAPATPYMLIFRNTGAENYRHLSASQQQELVGRWNAWFEGLVSQGKA